MVIFIHGGFTNSESFKKQYGLLEDYHCIFVDLPNYGKSICDDKYQYTFEYAAQAVIEVIDSISPKEKNSSGKSFLWRYSCKVNLRENAQSD